MHAAAVVLAVSLLSACGGAATRTSSVQPGTAPPTGAPSSTAAAVAVTPSPAAATTRPLAPAHPVTARTTPAATPTAAATPPDEPAGTYRGVRVVDGAVERSDAAALVLVLEAGIARWEAGCNTAGARVELGGGRLRLLEPPGSSAAMCDDVTAAREEWWNGVMTSEPSWSSSGDVLVLATAHARVELVRT